MLEVVIMIGLLYYFYVKGKLSPIDIEFANQKGLIPLNDFKTVMEMIADRQHRDLDMVRGK